MACPPFSLPASACRPEEPPGAHNIAHATTRSGGKRRAARFHRSRFPAACGARYCLYRLRVTSLWQNSEFRSPNLVAHFPLRIHAIHILYDRDASRSLFPSFSSVGAHLLVQLREERTPGITWKCFLLELRTVRLGRLLHFAALSAVQAKRPYNEVSRGERKRPSAESVS